MLRDLSIREFSDRLSSNEPAPGGGSASAAVAAMGAGLLVMTCNLTLGREKYKEVEEEMVELMDELETMRVWFLASIDRDSDAYDQVMEAFGMPKGSPEEKAARRDGIQRAMKGASDVPMDVAKRCVRALELAPLVVRMGNPNALSDAGCGALFLEAGMRGAMYNVAINLGSIKDEGYVRRMAEDVKALEARAATARTQIAALVDEGLRS
jgi:formiminotetrahydrofolate cyclodeaminase